MCTCISCETRLACLNIRQMESKWRWLLHNFLKVDAYEEEMVTGDGTLQHSLLNIVNKPFIREINLVFSC